MRPTDFQPSPERWWGAKMLLTFLLASVLALLVSVGCPETVTARRQGRFFLKLEESIDSATHVTHVVIVVQDTATGQCRAFLQLHDSRVGVALSDSWPVVCDKGR